MPILGLVWKSKNPRSGDDELVEELWQYLDHPLDDALPLAMRDGVAGSFGRTFVGVSRALSVNDDESPWRSPTLLARVGDVKGADEPETITTFASIERTQWFFSTCAFTAGTMVGVQLRRCAARDPAMADAAADLVGECVAHQMTLYSSTPLAIVPMLDLLADARVSACHANLVAWLEVIAESTGEPPTEAQDRDALVTLCREDATPEWMIEGIVERALRGEAAARAARAVLVAERGRIEKLGGKKVRALAKRLARARHGP